MISPSAEETIEGSPSARLMPLTGIPMLSIIVTISLFGITPSTSDSTRAKSFSVNSMRVPGSARTWKRICPASTEGKKSRPRWGKRLAREATTKTPNPTVTSARRCRAQSRYPP